MKKRIIFVVLLAMTLSACGTEQKVEVEKEEMSIETQIEETDTTSQDTLAENEDAQESPVETPTEQKPSLSSQGPTEQKPSLSSQGQTEQKPSLSSQGQAEQKPSSSSQGQTEQKPSSSSQTQAEQKTITRVDSYSEEVTGPEQPFKYGVTTYEWTSNYVGVYSDGSKKILASNTETRYNQDNYKATNDELRAESEATAAKNMAYYQEILQLVNEVRAEAGVAPLTLDMTMCKAATMRTLEMDYSGYYSHTRPDMSSCFTVLDYFGIDSGYCGENIAAGQWSPAYVMNSWKNSPGHYANMTNPEYTKMGVGFSNTGIGDMNRYWCQLFVR